MSVAGLLFTRTAGQTSTPLETLSGSYIYNGDPAYFHDWEFRTLMRLKFYEDAIKAKAQKKARRNSRRSPAPQDEPTDADAEADPPGEGTGGGDLASLAAAMSRESPSDTSRSSKHRKSSKPSVTSRASHGVKGDVDPLDELTASATQARTEMVQKVLEGLREEAFELARDIGVDVLTQPRGYGSSLRNSVMLCFPVLVKKLESSSRLDKSQVPQHARIKSLCCRTYLDDDDGGNSSRLLVAASSYQNR